MTYFLHPVVVSASTLTYLALIAPRLLTAANNGLVVLGVAGLGFVVLYVCRAVSAQRATDFPSDVD